MLFSKLHNCASLIIIAGGHRRSTASWVVKTSVCKHFIKTATADTRLLPHFLLQYISLSTSKIYTGCLNLKSFFGNMSQYYQLHFHFMATHLIFIEKQKIEIFRFFIQLSEFNKNRYFLFRYINLAFHMPFSEQCYNLKQKCKNWSSK